MSFLINVSDCKGVQTGLFACEKEDCQLLLAKSMYEMLRDYKDLSSLAEKTVLQKHDGIKFCLSCMSVGLHVSPTSDEGIFRTFTDILVYWIEHILLSSHRELPYPLTDNPDYYFKEILTHLVNIFDGKPDEDELERLKCCQKILTSIENFTSSSDVRIPQQYWKMFIEFLFTVTQLRLNQSECAVNSGQSMVDLSFCNLIKMWLRASHDFFPSPNMWNFFEKQFFSWLQYKVVVKEWVSLCGALTQSIARLLNFSNAKLPSKKYLSAELFSTLVNVMNKAYVFQTWYRFLHFCGNPVEILVNNSSSNLKYLNNDLNAVDSNTVQSLSEEWSGPLTFYSIMNAFTDFIQILTNKEFSSGTASPSKSSKTSFGLGVKCNSLFRLFGTFLFPSASTNLGDHDNVMSGMLNDNDKNLICCGQALACGSLCTIVCFKRTNEPIEKPYLTKFFSVINNVLMKASSDDSRDCSNIIRVAYILINSDKLFTLDIQGVSLIIPAYLKAIKFFLNYIRTVSTNSSQIQCRSHNDRHEFLGSIFDSCKNSIVEIMSSLLSLPLHYGALSIRLLSPYSNKASNSTTPANAPQKLLAYPYFNKQGLLMFSSSDILHCYFDMLPHLIFILLDLSDYEENDLFKCNNTEVQYAISKAACNIPNYQKILNNFFMLLQDMIAYEQSKLLNMPSDNRSDNSKFKYFTSSERIIHSNDSGVRLHSNSLSVGKPFREEQMISEDDSESSSSGMDLDRKNQLLYLNSQYNHGNRISDRSIHSYGNLRLLTPSRKKNRIANSSDIVEHLSSMHGSPCETVSNANELFRVVVNSILKHVRKVVSHPSSSPNQPKLASLFFSRLPQILVSIEFLSSLCRLISIKLTNPNHVISELCLIIGELCRLHSRYHSKGLHCIIHSALDCLGSWVVRYSPKVLHNEGLMRQVLAALEFTITGRDSFNEVDVSPQSSHYLSTRKSLSSLQSTNKTPVFKSEKISSMPISYKCQAAAEAVLNLITEFGNNFPNRGSGLESRDSLFTESTLYQHCRDNTAEEPFRFFVLDNSTIISIVEQPLVSYVGQQNETNSLNDQDNSSCHQFDQNYRTSVSPKSTGSITSENQGNVNANGGIQHVANSGTAQTSVPACAVIFRSCYGRQSWAFQYRYKPVYRPIPSSISGEFVARNSTQSAVNRPFNSIASSWLEHIEDKPLYDDLSSGNNPSDSKWKGTQRQGSCDSLKFLSSLGDISAVTKKTESPLNQNEQVSQFLEQYETIHQQVLHSRPTMTLPPLAPPQPCNEFQSARLLLAHLGFLDLKGLKSNVTSLSPTYPFPSSRASYTTTGKPKPIIEPPRLIALGGAVRESLFLLDKMPTRTCDTAYIFYVQRGQSHPYRILENARKKASILSNLAEQLGYPEKIGNHVGWTGNLDTSFDLQQNRYHSGSHRQSTTNAHQEPYGDHFDTSPSSSLFSPYSGDEDTRSEIIPLDSQSTKMQQVSRETNPEVSSTTSSTSRPPHCYDGREWITYWADISSEIAFIIPMPETIALRRDTTFGSDNLLSTLTSLSKSNPRNVAQRHTVLIDQFGDTPYGESDEDDRLVEIDINGHSLRTTVLDMPSPLSNSKDSKMSANLISPNRASCAFDSVSAIPKRTPTQSSSVNYESMIGLKPGERLDYKVFIIFVEAWEDINSFPRCALYDLIIPQQSQYQKPHSTTVSGISHPYSISNPPKNEADWATEIFIHPLESDLIRIGVRSHSPMEGGIEIQPPCDDLVVSQRALAGVIRHIILTMTSRQRIQRDTLLPHQRRNNKIREIIERHQMKFDESEFLLKLFTPVN